MAQAFLKAYSTPQVQPRLVATGNKSEAKVWAEHIVLQLGWDKPYLKHPQKGRQAAPSPASEGVFCPLENMRSTPLPYVKHPSNLSLSTGVRQISQKCFTHPKSIWMTSRFTYLHGPEQLVTTAGTQRPVTEWVTAHMLMDRTVGTCSLPSLQSRPSEFPQHWTQAMCVPQMPLCGFGCLSTYCLPKGTGAPYFLARQPWSPDYMSSTKISAEVIKTELDTLIVPVLIT